MIMGIRKSTRIENYRMIHAWTDAAVGFTAEAHKEDGEWAVTIGSTRRVFAFYMNAVDWVMDEYRQRKTEAAQKSAGDMIADAGGTVSDDEAADYLASARLMQDLGL